MGRHSKPSRIKAGVLLPALSGGAALATVASVIWVVPAMETPVASTESQQMDLAPQLLPLTSIAAAPSGDTTPPTSTPQRPVQKDVAASVTTAAPTTVPEPIDAPERTTETPRPTSTPTTTTRPKPTTTAPTTTPRRTTTTAPPTTTPPATSIAPPTTTVAEVNCGTAGFNGVKPHVKLVGNFLAARFNVPAGSIIGVASRGRVSDHPTGLALDFLVGRTTGDALAQYVLDNQSTLGVSYVIWRQRYNPGTGWELMEDRGSDTENHFDHVHVSFKPGADVSVDC